MWREGRNARVTAGLGMRAPERASRATSAGDAGAAVAVTAEIEELARARWRGRSGGCGSPSDRRSGRGARLAREQSKVSDSHAWRSRAIELVRWSDRDGGEIEELQTLIADGQERRTSQTHTRRSPGSAARHLKNASSSDSERRAEPRLAAPVPALDRPRAAAERRRGGGARQAHRARRHGRQAADGRGQPAPRGVDRQGLHRAAASPSST